MKYKICNKCGNRVDINTNFCPNCKSQSFRKMGEVVEANDSLVHRLFYWRYYNQYRLAKSKILLISVFVIFVIGGLTAQYFGWVLGLIGLFAAIVIGASGFLVHKFLEKPSAAQLENSDLGLFKDLYYTLLFWQDKDSGKFVFSKTKAITILIFIVCCFWSTTGAFNAAFMLIFASIFTVPAFIVGFVIHKFTYNPDEAKMIEPNKPKKIKETPKVEKKETKPQIKKQSSVDDADIDFRLLNYRDKIESLNDKFYPKDKAVRELIEKRFQPPQITYTRFITSVDNAKDLFEKQSASALNIISLASEYTPRIKEELDSKVDILKTIISKMDELTNELVITMDESKDEDVHTLIDDMDNLIDSVDDYK